MEVAIVGAGPAGAGVATALRDTGCDVTIVERAAEVGGRTRARRRRNCVYDPGANYLKSVDGRVAALVRDTLATGTLVDVTAPVWTHDVEGTVAPGDDRDAHKWTYESGLSHLVEALCARSDATVRAGTTVTHLSRTADQWVLESDEESLGRYDRVVLTPPAPRTASLLAASDWDGDARDRLVAALGAVSYRPVVSAILHYPFRLDRPYYALVNVDGDHPVSWVSREEEKRGHVPDGESLLIVQFSPAPSRRFLEEPANTVCAAAADHVAALLGDERLDDPDWTDRAGWRDALVDDRLDPARRADARANGLALAGDWVAGEARVHAALRTGLETGDRLAEACAAGRSR